MTPATRQMQLAAVPKLLSLPEMSHGVPNIAAREVQGGCDWGSETVESLCSPPAGARSARRNESCAACMAVARREPLHHSSVPGEHLPGGTACNGCCRSCGSSCLGARAIAAAAGSAAAVAACNGRCCGCDSSCPGACSSCSRGCNNAAAAAHAVAAAMAATAALPWRPWLWRQLVAHATQRPLPRL